MGIGIRIHFFHDDGVIKKIPYARFERLLSVDSIERFPHYAKKKMRCSMTYVELEHRVPARIMQTDFMIIPFAEDGSMDYEEFSRGDQLAFNMIDILPAPKTDNIIDISKRISRKRYLEEFTWKPTNKELNYLVNDILPR